MLLFTVPQCPRPQDIRYGGYKVYNHYFPQGYIPYKVYPTGIKIEYYCHPPYAVLGQAVHTCKQGGHWSHQPPTCERKCKDYTIKQVPIL